MKKQLHLLIALTLLSIACIMAQNEIKSSNTFVNANNEIVKNEVHYYFTSGSYESDFDNDTSDSLLNLIDNREPPLFDENDMRLMEEIVNPEQVLPSNNRTTCFEKIRENTDGSLVRPLLMIEGYEEGASLLPVKAKIAAYIEQKKKEGVLSSASVYINNTNSSNHIEVNPEEYYSPASILKVPLLLQCLKKEENEPGFLHKKILFKQKYQSPYNPTITNKSIVEGQSYSIDELLEYMIVYSDNQAYFLLYDQFPYGEFQNLCLELGIPSVVDKVKRENKQHYFIATTNSVSRFFRVLFNGTLVSHKLSDYGLNLLLKSDFNDGLLQGVDKNIKVAHKFGERYEEGITQLHEFGIVYLKNEPYIIGVMTKGENNKKLAEIIAEISKITFEELSKKQN